MSALFKPPYDHAIEHDARGRQVLDCPKPLFAGRGARIKALYVIDNHTSDTLYPWCEQCAHPFGYRSTDGNWRCECCDGRLKGGISPDRITLKTIAVFRSEQPLAPEPPRVHYTGAGDARVRAATAQMRAEVAAGMANPFQHFVENAEPFPEPIRPMTGPPRQGVVGWTNNGVPIFGPVPSRPGLVIAADIGGALEVPLVEEIPVDRPDN